MTKYIHLKKGLADKGKVVPLDKLDTHIKNPKKQDWYRSAYYYPKAFLKYFDEKGSIAGYTGDAFSDTLYWDIDCSDLDTAKEHATNLIHHLDDLGLLDSVRLFFSGSKGFHVVLYTENEFTPEETNAICYNIAMEAEVNIDLVVYNKTRAFRIPNTAHQKTKLLKIELEMADFVEMGGGFKKYITKVAKKPVQLSEVTLADCDNLKEKYKVKEVKVLSIGTGKEYIEDIDMTRCPPKKKRCVYVLENGGFGDGERENGLVRLAAFYKAQGFDEEMAESLMTTALDKRDRRYDVKPYNDSDTQRIINTVFSDAWNGGTYSCKTDDFLSHKCDGKGACSQKEEKKFGKTMSITDLVTSYIKDADSALEEYPQFGIKWIDDRVLLRPKEITVLNAANGAGKTSLMMKILKKLNLQGIWHKVYSMDMSDSSLFLKFATSYTDYSYKEIEAIFNIHTRDIEEMKRIAAIVEKNLPYTKFDFSASYDINDMEKAIDIDENQLDIKYQLIFVDYAGRIKGKYESMYANSTLTALELNDVAKRTNAHWFIISQISRERGDHTSPLRTSRVSKDSGSWEENATTVVNMWRPFGNDFNKDYYVHIYIAKNRKGALEEMVFGWKGKKGQIKELEEIEHHEYDELYYEEFKEMPPNPHNNMEQKEIKESRFEEKVKEDDPAESDASYAARTSGRTQRNKRRRRRNE